MNLIIIMIMILMIIIMTIIVFIIIMIIIIMGIRMSMMITRIDHVDDLTCSQQGYQRTSCQGQHRLKESFVYAVLFFKT